jgi:hypothetical protein
MPMLFRLVFDLGSRITVQRRPQIRFIWNLVQRRVFIRFVPCALRRRACTGKDRPAVIHADVVIPAVCFLIWDSYYGSATAPDPFNLESRTATSIHQTCSLCSPKRACTGKDRSAVIHADVLPAVFLFSTYSYSHTSKTRRFYCLARSTSLPVHIRSTQQLPERQTEKTVGCAS